MKQTNIFILSVFILLAGQHCVYPQITPYPRAKLTVKVVDEEGAPLSNALVRIGFFEGKMNTGVTDSNGLFGAEGNSKEGDANYYAEKEGYYSSRYDYRYSGNISPRGGFYLSNKWQPWAPTNVVILKPIKNPVPMYVKRVETHLQEPEKAIGYDLTVGDWIAPYGKGVVADMLLEINRRVTNWKDYESKLKVTFSNPGDGLYRLGVLPTLEGSMLKSPHEAPETGYQNEIIWRKDRIPAKDESGRDEQIKEASEYGACIFRVRTVIDEQGKVTKAMYGKILPCLEFDPRESSGAFLRFTYYLNPSGTRDLEFNGENLFSADRQKYDP